MIRWWVLLGLNFLVTSGYWFLFENVQDEAYSVLGAQRILAGEWPYRDWNTHHFPGHYYLSALFFGIFGVDRLSTRILMSLISALQGLAIFAISERTINGPVRYLPWVLWTATGISQSAVLNYHWFSSLAATLTLYCAVRWVSTSSPRWALLSGMAASLSVWILQSEGLVSMLILLVCALRFRPGHYGKLGVGFLSSSALFWLPALPYLPQVFDQSFLQVTQFVAANYYPYSWKPLTTMYQQIQGFPLWEYPTGWMANWSLWFHNCVRHGALYPILLGGLIVAERRRHRPSQVVAWAGFLWFLVGFARQSLSYTAYLSPVIYLQLGILLSLWHRGRVLVYLWAAWEILGCLSRLYVWRQHAVYPISTRTGLYWTDSLGVFQVNETIRDWMGRYLPPGTRVLGYPYCPRIYTQYRLRNPIPQPILPAMLDDSVIQKAAQRLRDSQVEWLIVQRLNPEEMSNEFLIDPQVYRERVLRHEAIILADYERIEGDENLGLYRRKASLHRVPPTR